MAFNFMYNYPQVARDSGFKLRNYKDGPLDWRLIGNNEPGKITGSMEIERILRDQSFEQIDAVLNHLSEVPLGSILDSNVLDSGIAKKFLEETVMDLKESHSTSERELVSIKRSFSEANKEILMLHKKITQMEAIHEVIYPCHLCTKNFVSNDALNLHISRKHRECSEKLERKSEVKNATCHDRENDLTLINTIKLELEIKHLKERLNVAEREIKEKNIKANNNNMMEKDATVFEKSEKKSVRSIGIQSNLSEVKEQDDKNRNDFNTSLQNQEQLGLLQERLQEFEKWKEEIKLQNSQFLNEINNKILNIGTAIELNRNQNEQVDHKTEESISSAEHLELLLTKKAEEIGKAAAATLENVVHKMERSYKDKLHQIEKDLNKLNELYSLQNNAKYIENPINIENPTGPQNDLQLFKEEGSVTESGHTFVKLSNVTFLKEHMSETDSTNIEDSILQEENEDGLYNGSIKSDVNSKHIANEVKLDLDKQLASKAKIVTRKDAKKIINYHLALLGIDAETKTLTPLLKRRYLNHLVEKRGKSKQEHPQFYVIRNKINKFVTKLCSTKMPQNAEILLQSTRHGKTNNTEEYPMPLSEDDVKFLKTSTPLIENPTTTNQSFKQRLQRILASPVRKPDDGLIKVMVHREDNYQKPVPMPRKRVVFNQPVMHEKQLKPMESDESQTLHSPAKITSNKQPVQPNLQHKGALDAPSASPWQQAV